MRLRNEVIIYNLMYDTEEVCDEFLNQTKKDVKRLNETKYLERLQWIDDSFSLRGKWYYDSLCLDCYVLSRN